MMLWYEFILRITCRYIVLPCWASVFVERTLLTVVVEVAPPWAANPLKLTLLFVYPEMFPQDESGCLLSHPHGWYRQMNSLTHNITRYDYSDMFNAADSVLTWLTHDMSIRTLASPLQRCARAAGGLQTCRHAERENLTADSTIHPVSPCEGCSIQTHQLIAPVLWPRLNTLTWSNVGQLEVTVVNLLFGEHTSFWSGSSTEDVRVSAHLLTVWPPFISFNVKLIQS